MAIRCSKCRNRILHEESALVVLLYKRPPDSAGYQVVKSTTLKDDSVAIHLNGDRQCGREISGYRSKLRKELEISHSSDLSFLDEL